MPVKTRFAPSPTGYLHIGGARTALFSWLFARQQGGQFVLRIEDTDRERSTEISVQAILDGMSWLGLDYDEGPYFQTQRLDRYKEVIQQLLDEGKAYYCYCSKEELDAMRAQQMARKEKPRYNGYWRDRSDAPPPGIDPVVRFRNPTDGQVIIDDLVYGKITVENSELDDLVIARPDGTPTYNFCVVVDDRDMAITHVIRGEDHINNTPRQVNILESLGAERPVYAHLPMILGDDGKRISKRHGAVSVMQYQEEGYLPKALLNYLVRLGWSHGDQEIFSINEMIDHFSLDVVNKSGGMFNAGKLAWVNRQYLQSSSPESLEQVVTQQLKKLGIDPTNGPALSSVIEVMADRVDTVAQMAEQSRFWFADFDEYDPQAAKKHLRVIAQPILETLRERFSVVEQWRRVDIETTLHETIETLQSKIGKVGPPLRVAVTGSTVSPSLDVTLELLGKPRTLARIERAIVYIETRKSAE